MSVYWKLSLNKRHQLSRGFSLLEILVVVFIIGLASALILPNFPLLFDRISYANQRDSLFREINTLPYAAFESNQDMVLTEEGVKRTVGLESDADIPTFIDANDIDVKRTYQTASILPVRLNIPDGWTISVSEPIIYRASGFCTGGTIAVNAGRLKYEYDLAPPYCQIRE